MYIEDGRGKGYRAQVDGENRLLTRAIVTTELGHQSEDEAQAFTIYAKRQLAAADTNEGVLYMENEGSGQIIISHITFSSNSTTGSKFEVFFDPTGVSGGDHFTPLNLNRGSKKTSAAHAKHGGVDLVYTISAENEFLDVRIANNTFTFDFGDALILTPGASLLIQAESRTLGDKVRANVYFYEKGEGGGGH
jgi:hypothetical protein